MSLVPAFEIGFWNAWIPAVVYLLFVYIPIFVLKDYSKKLGQGENYGKVEKFMEVLFYILLLGSIFLPLKLQTAWFYTGLAIYLLGFIITVITIINVASIPLGKLFKRGIYHYSRNPGYLGQMLVFIGIGVASASWIYLLLSVVLIVLTILFIGVEERVTVDKFGETYQEYMNRTPRWLGIPKTGK